MQKYKIVASKSQKKYTLILSADSEIEAKERLHKDGYSILSINLASDDEIFGKKFIFQIQKNDEIKNGVIVGEDIFKVYIKLVDELGYNVISLYPEGDQAHNNAEKKQEIMNKLKQGYEIQKKDIKKNVGVTQEVEEKFYLQKRIKETSILIEKVIKKFDNIFVNSADFTISEEKKNKLSKIYEVLLHIKGSTNIIKLQEIGELALIKLAEVELESVEQKKDESSRKLLSETNSLLKQIGSDKKFIEEDKDYKKKIILFFQDIKKTLSQKNNKKNSVKPKKSIDTDSYDFLKTILLLEKYKEKLNSVKKEKRKKIFLFLNPFKQTEEKDRILLKENVIKQNIYILKVKKTGAVSSYTSVKKGVTKLNTYIVSMFKYIEKNIFVGFCVYSVLFFGYILYMYMEKQIISFQASSIVYILLLIILYIILSLSKNPLAFAINIVFLFLMSIFSVVNF